MNTRYGRIHVMRGEGDGATLYLGHKRGAPFIAVSLHGFNGWTSRPKWMPGGWEYFAPHVHTGRLFTDRRGHWWETRVLLPARLVRFYRWKITPSGRRYMREHGHDTPQVTA